MSKGLDIRAIVTDDRVLTTIEFLGACHLNQVSATIKQVESAYNAGHPGIKDMIDYVLFDED